MNNNQKTDYDKYRTDFIKKLNNNYDKYGKNIINDAKKFARKYNIIQEYLEADDFNYRFENQLNKSLVIKTKIRENFYVSHYFNFHEETVITLRLLCSRNEPIEPCSSDYRWIDYPEESKFDYLNTNYVMTKKNLVYII